MTVNINSLVPASVLRNLGNKKYEKRKNAAKEIAVIVKQLVLTMEHDKISAIIDHLAEKFTNSDTDHVKKGGMLGLSAVAVGLSTEAAQHLEQIVQPVLDSLLCQNIRVRYYACEALYNIAKVVRGDFMIFFYKTFDALCKLSADPDCNVQDAAHLLDQLMKDIVTESDQLSIEEFIPLIRDRMDILNPQVRQFLVGWITVLDSVPDIDMLSYLPDFLDGLINMLSDEKCEIRHQVDCALSEFLLEIKNSDDVEYGRMAGILVHRASSHDEFTRLTSITWINEFIKLGGNQLIHYYADILGVILPRISDEEEKIRVIARETNEELLAIKVSPLDGFNIESVISITIRELKSEWEATRIEALRWIITLLTRHWKEVISYLNDVFDCLLSALSDQSDEVVLLVLEVHACMARDPLNFSRLVTHLIHNLHNDCDLLEKRGSYIIRQLCLRLGAERVYLEISSYLEHEVDLDFASTMVHALNLILLTSTELADLRDLLKKLLVNSSGKDLFVSLYSSWCHSPVATISLCFLVQAYQLATSVIQLLGEEDINVKFLVHLDKFIRLIETPIFANLRLQLLEPAKRIWLLKALYGLLMLLPQQSAAFKILWTRLKAVPYSMGTDEPKRLPPGNPYSNILQLVEDSRNQDVNENFSSLDIPFRLRQFQKIQKLHRMLSRSTLSPCNSTVSQEMQIFEGPLSRPDVDQDPQ